ILDADPLPGAGFAVTSGSGPQTKSANLPIALSTASGQAVTISYTITGGTAVAGVDYPPSAAAGTVTVKPGQTQQTLSIPLLNDHRNRPDRTLVVTLRSAAHASLGGNTSFTYTIRNTNPPPTVGFAQAKASGSEAVA